MTPRTTKETASQRDPSPRRKPIRLIVIHGHGSTFRQTIQFLLDLPALQAVIHDDTVWLDSETAVFIKPFLRQPLDNPLVGSFQELILGRLLQAEYGTTQDIARKTGLDMAMLRREYGFLGIPMGLGARFERGRQLQEKANAELTAFFDTCTEIREALDKAAAVPVENEAREIMTERFIRAGYGDEALNLLDTVRGLFEGGGDLDTVTSALFYTYWLRQKAKTPPVYGRDYRYVYVNYHEGLGHLKAFAPANVYMADFPIGAWPGFESEMEELAECGITIERFEDHHPYTIDHLDGLKRLKKKRLVKYFSLSGPLDGEESDGDTYCGADMVYHSCIEGKPYDGRGIAVLKKAAHSEDFVEGRHRLGRLLTELIKGGVCKIELIQLMLESVRRADLPRRLQARGWTALSERWGAYFDDIRDQLLEHAYVLRVKRPTAGPAESGGPALATGSDVPDPRQRHTPLRLMLTLAVSSRPGEPRVPVGRAVEFYAQTFPNTDYLFYCYGAALMVSRRLNQADMSVNLGALMPAIGGDGDGGHAGAAVGRPEANAHFPRTLFGRVNRANFRRFVDYIAYRLRLEEFEVLGIENLSKPATRSIDIKRLGIVLVSALLLGGLLMLLLPRFQLSKVSEGNRGFYPFLETRHERGKDVP